MAEKHNYQAFLVRLWTVTQNGGFVWRAPAQDAHTGARGAFADPKNVRKTSTYQAPRPHGMMPRMLCRQGAALACQS
jgi:hypothetical protein